MSKKTFSSQEKMLIDKKQEVKHINLYQPSIRRKNKNIILKTQESLKKTNDLKNQFKTVIQSKKSNNFRGLKQQRNTNNFKLQTDVNIKQVNSQNEVDKSITQNQKIKQNFQLTQDSSIKGEELFQQIYQHLLKNKDKPEVMQQIYHNIFEPPKEKPDQQPLNSSKNQSDKINFQTSVSDISNTQNMSSYRMPTQSFKMTQSEFHQLNDAQKFKSHKLIFNSEVQEQPQNNFNLYSSQNKKPLKITLLQGWTSNHKMGLTCIKFYDENYQYIEANCQYYINDKLVNRKFSNLFQNLKLKQKETFFNYKVCNVFKFKFKNDKICDAICFWNVISQPNLGIKKIIIQYNGQKNEVKIPKSEPNNQLDKNFYIYKLGDKIDVLQLRHHIQKQLSNVEFKHTLMPLRKSSSFVTTNQQIETPRFYHKAKLNKTIELQREQDEKQQKVHSMSIDLENFNFGQKKTSYQIPLLKKSLKPRKNILSINFSNQNPDNINQQNIYQQKTPLFNDDQTFFNQKNRKKSNSLINSELSKFSIISNVSENCMEDLIGTFQNHQIPQLPKLSGIIIQINSNWGDKNYVGLNNIEIFDDCGMKIDITIDDFEIFSQQKQGIFYINQENTNLFNDQIITQQENQQWKIPLKYKFPITVKVKFKQVQKIAMIRIWNYNVNRINKNIGVKQIMITNIDKDDLLFCGDIKKSLGGSIQLFKNNQETILFTQDIMIIQKISKNDWLFKLIKQKKKQKLKAQCLIDNLQIHRPITQDKKLQISKKSNLVTNNSIKSNILEKEYLICKKLKIVLQDNWGHQNLIGFQKICFLDQNMQFLSEKQFEMKSNLKFYNKSYDFLDSKFLQSDKPKYLMFKKNTNYFIEITFNSEVKLSAIQIKNIDQDNYTQAGVKILQILIDDILKTPKEGFFIKKASQKNQPDQFQIINFPIKTQFNPKILGCTSSQPSGFNLKIHLINTYGDLYYIGLNEIQIFDQYGIQLRKNTFKVNAEPQGVFVLENMEKDQRKVTNLFNGITDSCNQKDIFLAPLEKCKSLLNYAFVNEINIEFYEPQTIGKITFHNYKKTPQRGVKEIKIFLDDFLLKHDYLIESQIQPFTTFYFNKNLYEKQNGDEFFMSYNNIIKNKIQLVNEKQILIQKDDEFIQDFERPQTGANEYSCNQKIIIQFTKIISYCSDFRLYQVLYFLKFLFDFDQSKIQVFVYDIHKFHSCIHNLDLPNYQVFLQLLLYILSNFDPKL